MGSAAGQRARHFKLDPDARRRVEPAIATTNPARGNPEGGRARYKSTHRPARRTSALRIAIEKYLFEISAVLLLMCAAGWGLLFYSECRSLFAAAPGPVTSTMSAGNADVGKADAFGTSTYMSTYARIDPPQAPTAARLSVTAGGESAASIVAKEWSFFQPVQQADRGQAPAQAAEIKPPAHVAPVHMAALDAAAVESASPQITAPPPVATAVASQTLAHQVLARQVPINIVAKTSLVDFETAPFPYHGNMPGTDRPFLNAGEEGHRGHVNFRGHVYWESQTYSDDRVLLHIPPGFDPKRPAVMVVFFHGHGADLARDVRDRQLLPAQITAAGANAVLVAPQFAFDAADSSAGKFWEPDGFKRFLDEAAQKLAKMYGDPRSATAFANMPIVIVAYSGGFGPTLAVLDRGGVRSRVRGLVLLDALYAGIDTFADWIANNRSAFFVSSYTPYTEHHNADLEHLLNERSVPYSSELRRNHLQGTVAFLPAGDVPHRDFVTHAWTDNPITDILARMDDLDPKIETAEITASKRN